MSTRAIIAVYNMDGSITGIWCWNDGYNIIDNLKTDFSTDQGLDFLFKNFGMINTIFTKEEFEDYKSWAEKESIDISGKEFIPFGNSVILQDKTYKGSEPQVYKDIQDALDQDINVLYVAAGSGTWHTYYESRDMNIITFATYDDYGSRTEYEYTIGDLRAEYMSDNIDMDVPSNDAPIADCKLNGIPLYFDNFLELVKVFGIER